jgi:hypothetical protein
LLGQSSFAQRVILIKAIPIYGWNNAFEGAAGYSFGAHTHFDKIGFHANYYHGYTKPTSSAFYKQHMMLDGTVSFRFGHSHDGEDDKARLWNIGFAHVNGYKHELVKYIEYNLRPPDYNPDESARRYDEFFTDLHYRTTYLSFGYERLKKTDFQYAGWVTRQVLNPFGLVMGTVSRYEEGRVFYTSSWYISALGTVPGAISYEPVGFYSHVNGPPRSDSMRSEPLLKNHIGVKMGYEVGSLTPFGFVFGLEAGLMPGVFNDEGVYGPGFPDDNIYFLMKFGFASGLGSEQ